jgi:hypothetical protein
MVAHGDSDDYISDITGLTLDEIGRIRDNKGILEKRGLLGGVVLETYADKCADKKFKEGQKYISLQTAKKLILNKKYSDEDISDITGLTLDEIKRIKEDNKEYPL